MCFLGIKSQVRYIKAYMQFIVHRIHASAHSIEIMCRQSDERSRRIDPSSHPDASIS